MAGLRAVDEAILQRDAKAAPQEALSFRPPDNSPFRRHFTRGFLLCLYAYSTRFAWECQCPFCTNPPGVSLCRLRDARSGGGPVRRTTRAGTGGTGAVGAISHPGRDGGTESLSAHRQRGRANRISFVRRRFARVFPRAVEPPVLFRVPARRNRVPSAYRRADHVFYTHRRTACVMRRRTAVQKKRRAAGRSCGAAFFSPGQTSFAFLPNSLRISGRSRRGARKQ